MDIPSKFYPKVPNNPGDLYRKGQQQWVNYNTVLLIFISHTTKEINIF